MDNLGVVFLFILTVAAALWGLFAATILFLPFCLTIPLQVFAIVAWFVATNPGDTMKLPIALPVALFDFVLVHGTVCAAKVGPLAGVGSMSSETEVILNRVRSAIFTLLTTPA